jgi:hypothetical protein
MMGGGSSGGGNSGDHDGKDSSSSSDSAKKSNKPNKQHSGGDSSSDSGKKGNKKDKDDGRKGGEDNGNTKNGASGNLIDDLFGTGDESSSGATTTTTTEKQPSLFSQFAAEPTYKPPELPENFGLVPSQKILGDGSKVQIENNALPGEKQDYTITTTWFTDDTVTKVEKGPSYIYKEKWVPVGDSRWIYSAGTNSYVFTREPDNTRTWDFRDGRTQTQLPDKTLIEKQPAPDAPGQFMVTTTLPDKTKTVKDPDGKETFLDANGNTQKIVFPKKDGTFNVYDPNTGTTVNTDTKPDR